MKIFSADLWPPGRNDQTFSEASRLILTQGQMRLRQLVENVLLYDQVVIPTDNFLSIRFLTEAFGAESLALLMDEEVLKFTRLKGQVMYAGAGHGLTVIKVDVPESIKNNAPVAPAWLPTGVAATAILSEMPGVTPRRAKQIAAKFVHATREIDLDTVREVLRSRSHLSARSSTIDPNMRIAEDNLDDLGTNPDQLKFLENLDSDIQRDDIGKLLLIARTELELIAKEKSGCEDLSTLSPVGKLLAGKSASLTSLEKLYEITDVPDLGTAALSDAISMKQIVALRNSRHWREFAKWFHECCVSEPERVGKEYVKLLKGTAPLDTTFFRIVRLLIPAAIGLFSPVAGMAIGVADMFGVPKLKEPSPKYFIEKLGQLTNQQAGTN